MILLMLINQPRNIAVKMLGNTTIVYDTSASQRTSPKEHPSYCVEVDV